MQITIDLPPDLEQDLVRQAALSNIPLQALILQALRQLTQNSQASQWLDTVLSYQGISDFPAFESYHDGIAPNGLRFSQGHYSSEPSSESSLTLKYQ